MSIDHVISDLNSCGGVYGMYSSTDLQVQFFSPVSSRPVTSLGLDPGGDINVSTPTLLRSRATASYTSAAAH